MQRLVVLLFLTCACARGGDALRAELAGPDPDARAAVAGIVAELPSAPQGLPQAKALVVVGSLADAPAGSTPLAGANVAVLGRPGGTFEGTATTGADGSFLVADLEVTHATLEVRRDPMAAPDLSFPLTLVRGATVVAGAAYLIDRQTAIDAVVAVAPASSAVVCSQNPLPAGTLVFGALDSADGDGPTLDDTHVVAEDDEWLVYVDPSPEAVFEHDVSYFFVDAKTGEVAEQPASSWPAVNYVPMWFTGDLVSLTDETPPGLDWTEGFPDGADFALSEDIVAFPDNEDSESAAELSALAQTTGVDPDDFFAVFWCGSVEPWFVLDTMRMRAWAFGHGLRVENQKTILYGKSAFDNLEDSERTIIDFGGDAAAWKQNTAAEIADLASKVQKRRDEGGDPLLFVFATSHGNSKGQFLVLDLTPGGLVMVKFFRSKLMVDADEILPIQNIPACRVRAAIATCHAKFHVLQWLPHYLAMEPPPDVQFYTSSGNNQSTGRRLTSSLWGVVTDHELKPIGVRFSRDWYRGGAFFAPDGKLTFAAGFGGAFTRYSNHLFLANHQSAAPNDRLCFDPGWADPCLLEPPPEPVGDLVMFSDDGSAVTYTHHVGPECNFDLVYSVKVTNTTNEAVSVQVIDGNHLLGNNLITLVPGQSEDLDIYFACDTQQQFTSPIRILVRGLVSGRELERDVDVTVKFD